MHYCDTKFTPDVIKQGLEVFKSVGGSAKACYYNVRFKNQEEWNYDSASEFYSDYVRDIKWGTIDSISGDGYGFRVMYKEGCSWVTIEAPERSKIEDVHYIFLNSQENCRLPEQKQNHKAQPVVFIGHGRSAQWRDLKDHLQDKHKHIIEAYEVGARAGHTIRDILDEMMTKSSFALLVLTAEDRDENGAFHARENVIHELGLFQGKLGFARAIAIVEEGTTEFSNIHGIQQIRFSKGNIRETFGDILATIKREFHEVND
jgi:predicted nucleotide-binding protein